jgi:hypothetical protein
MDEADISVRDNPQLHHYEIFVDGDLAGFSAYRDDAGRRVFTHTQVDDDYEGQGIGSALARGALDDTRRAGLAVVPRCPFVDAFIKHHPEYADLVAR